MPATPPPADQLWPLVEAQRHEAVELLDGLSEEQWSTPNACGSWSVRDVAGHLTMGWNVSMPKFMLGLIRHRGFNNFNLVASKKLGERPTADIVADLRANVAHRFTPPGAGPEAPLSDLITHIADIREALGIAHDIDPAAAKVTLDMFANPAKGAPFPLKDSAGMHFVATDMDWESGSGAKVEGTVHALLMALSGRLGALDQLSGEGVSTLRERSI